MPKWHPIYTIIIHTRRGLESKWTPKIFSTKSYHYYTCLLGLNTIKLFIISLINFKKNNNNKY